MLCDDSEGPSVEVGVKLSNGPHKCKAFPLGDRVVASGRGEKATGERDNAVVATLVLSQYGTDPMTAGIGSHFGRSGHVEVG